MKFQTHVRDLFLQSFIHSFETHALRGSRLRRSLISFARTTIVYLVLSQSRITRSVIPGDECAIPAFRFISFLTSHFHLQFHLGTYAIRPFPISGSISPAFDSAVHVQPISRYKNYSSLFFCFYLIMSHSCLLAFTE